MDANFRKWGGRGGFYSETHERHEKGRFSGRWLVMGPRCLDFARHDGNWEKWAPGGRKTEKWGRKSLKIDLGGVCNRKWTRIFANGEVGGGKWVQNGLKMVGLAIWGLEARVNAWGGARPEGAGRGPRSAVRGREQRRLGVAGHACGVASHACGVASPRPAGAATTKRAGRRLPLQRAGKTAGTQQAEPLRRNDRAATSVAWQASARRARPQWGGGAMGRGDYST